MEEVKEMEEEVEMEEVYVRERDEKSGSCIRINYTRSPGRRYGAPDSRCKGPQRLRLRSAVVKQRWTLPRGRT